MELRERSEGTYTFRMPASDVEVEASFVRTEESPPPAPDVPGNLPFADVRESDITREQLAAILYRFARYKGWDTGAGVSLDRFPDAARISPYAVQPIAWAVGEGLISGMANGTMSPGGTATRAEAATILMRLEALARRME